MKARLQQKIMVPKVLCMALHGELVPSGDSGGVKETREGANSLENFEDWPVRHKIFPADIRDRLFSDGVVVVKHRRPTFQQ